MSAAAHSDPARMRTASSEGSVQLRHPTPDLQSLQGAYVQNVERLEERAERMSLGSDIGEEIRKLQLEQKLSDSRRQSMYSNAVDHPQRPRNASTSSYANSIVEVNGAARYGGYSPAGYIGSPIGSLRSGSWSHVSHGVSNPLSRSMSKTSRLGQVSGAQFADEVFNSPIDDPTMYTSGPQRRTSRLSNSSSNSSQLSDDSRERRMKRVSTGRLPSDGSFTQLYNQLAETNNSAQHLSAPRIPSDTSFTDIYDQIAGEIRDQLDVSTNDVHTHGVNTSVQRTPVNELSHQYGGEPSARNSTTYEEEMPPRPPPHSFLPPPVTESGLGLDEIAQGAATHESDGQPDGDHYHADGGDSATHQLERPSTAASTDTYQQAQVLFQDFDGAHYSPSIRGSIREPSTDEAELREMRRSSMLKMLQKPDQTIPPPDDGMVYYPAPVPRLLKLPQRLSQMPSASVQAKRRTQLLESLPNKIKKAAPWLERDTVGSETGRPSGHMSKASLAALPPQLRASMFFEHQAKRQEVEVKDHSAVATLEDLLDASARAPVSAFTDHPIVGNAGGDVYKKDGAMRSSISLQRVEKTQEKKKEKRRSSFLGLRRSSISSTNALDDNRSKTPNKLQKRNSAAMSMALDDSALARGPNGEIGGGRSGATTPLQPRLLDENGEPIEDDQDDEDALEDEEDEAKEEEEEIFGPPTTLLAELQLRKKQLKQRNRTAVTAFPGGMHSTLLELDAVAHLEGQKRKKTRVALAWEDPELHAAEEAAKDDDDVPLGMLFGNTSKLVKDRLAEQGLGDWDRPLGLLERRQLEDNEPLSRRRNRLLGVDPNAAKRPPSFQVTAAAEEDADSEHEGETLAQRLRRLKDKKGLDAAIGDMKERPVSEAFTTEMLGELGELGVASEDAQEKDKRISQGGLSFESQPKSGASSPRPNRSQNNTPGTPHEEEEETLGQRRARLQREATEQSRRAAQAALDPQARMSTVLNPDATIQPVMQVPLRASRSMADILNAYPTGKNDARKVSDKDLVAALPQGSLLAKNEEIKAARKSQIELNNKRSTSFQKLAETQKPLVDLPQHNPIGERRKSSGFKGGMFNDGMGGLQSAQDPNFAMNNFPGQMPYQNGMMGMQYPQMGMDMNGFGAMSNPNLLHGMMGMPTYPAMGMGMSGFGAMSTPNLINPVMGTNGFGMSSPNLMNGMARYGAGTQNGFANPYQQHQSSFGPMQAQEHFMAEPLMDQKTRQRVDTWRQGVMP